MEARAPARRTPRCRLVVTTGGTGPNRRDVTPEATRAVLDLELPGFGEIMRLRTFDAAPTSILSRATAGIRRACLIVNLPGRPSAVAECLAVLGPAIKKALELLEPEYLEG
jgi:molybdopterin adenylyltransferase